MTIDDLLAAEIVTADGRLRHVDAETEPDLFWALRGGGGNFGVVTRLRYRLHPVDTVFGGTLILPATPDVICGFLARGRGRPGRAEHDRQRAARRRRTADRCWRRG